jgi:glycogen operon protein
MQRIDTYPTHEFNGYKIRPGKPEPFGATLVPGGINFAIYSTHATACVLVLYEKGANTPFVEIPFYDDFRVGHVYAMIVFNLNYENLEYGFRFDGPYEPALGHRFDPNVVVMDPYTRQIGGRDDWGMPYDEDDPYPHRAQVMIDDFDWEGDKPLNIPIEDLIVYEMHVRGFTQHSSSKVKSPGTFAGLVEKIPYLKDLGVNCIELMPIFEFDEFEYDRINPITGERLINYWGYSTVGFFSPKAGYAATSVFGMQADELKNLIKECHNHGIEVWLDVVFNHTAEGNEDGPTISFRGIDNKTYYLLTPDGHYYNFSGTGNTLNCNHPIVRTMVRDCLRYWVSEYHIDGFRFDLASILGRDQTGAPLPNPPLLEMLAYDPILANSKLIAEAWDAGGLYQVGSFPAYGRWAEWNGKYRDDVRKFIKGDHGMVGALATRVQGSPDLYLERGPTSSVNFVTAHDGFTLWDLVSYNNKHNYANGEDGRDGTNENYSWNCGWEGETDKPEILSLRERQFKNFLTVLMVSRGVPMLLMGDEVGHTKHGNNNTYCHDNELNWFDWGLVRRNKHLYRFTRNLIMFRKKHHVLRSRKFFDHQDYVGSGYPDISFHGTKLWQPDWSENSYSLAFLLCGCHARDGFDADDDIYVIMNAYWDALQFELPPLEDGKKWRVSVNTMMLSPQDSYSAGREPILQDQECLRVGDRSVVVLVAR